MLEHLMHIGLPTLPIASLSMSQYIFAKNPSNKLTTVWYIGIFRELFFNNCCIMQMLDTQKSIPILLKATFLLGLTKTESDRLENSLLLHTVTSHNRDKTFCLYNSDI